MFGEVDPASRGVNGTVLSSRFDAGRERETGDGEAHQLALTAAQAADRIAHQEDLAEVIATQGGASKSLAGTELALDRNPVARVQSEIRSMSGRGMRMLFPSALTIELILKFHLQC